MDAFSRWVDAHLLNNLSARAAIQTLWKTFKYVRLPRTLVSDNGTNFVSEEFEKKFLHGNFIKHVRTPPGHHQYNGINYDIKYACAFSLLLQFMIKHSKTFNIHLR